jgi:hypothetical protein
MKPAARDRLREKHGSRSQATKLLLRRIENRCRA